jgi:hypothetical protein
MYFQPSMSMYTISSQFRIVHEYQCNVILCNAIWTITMCERFIGHHDEKR